MIQQLHVPRTGGTALATGLAACRATHRQGHTFRLSHLRPGDMAIVIVRDPVQRFLSAWAWDTRHLRPWDSPDELLLEHEIPDTEVFRPQSWWLDGDLGRLLWVGRTETLDADVRSLGALLGTRVALPASGAERNASPLPHPPLSDAALAVVRERYADDYRLLDDLT